MSVRTPIPALDGLRFLAAMLVVAAHMASMWMERFGHVEWLAPVKTLSALGMSLFFVLSGFVIHYNYRAIAHEKGAMRRFAMARFARLYPLYLLVLALGVGAGGHWRDMEPVQFFTYLTLTQSWVYWKVGDQALINSLGGLAAVTWSISTEIFFYVAYACGIAQIVSRLKTTKALIEAGLGAYILWMAFYSWFAFTLPAETHEEFSDSLQRWVVYFSPYLRLAEFIVGACAAQAFLQQRPAPNYWWLTLAALAMLAAHAAVYSLPEVAATYGAALYGPLVAVFLLLCAQCSAHRLARFFAHPALRGLGHASYSIYLWHGVVLVAAFAAMARLELENVAVGIMFAAMAALLLGAVISYRLFEIPARRFIRGH